MAFDHFMADPAPLVAFLERIFDVDLSDVDMATPSNTREDVYRRITVEGTDTAALRARVNAEFDNRMDAIAALPGFARSASLYRAMLDRRTGVFRATLGSGGPGDAD
jgi:hypothetical protein